MDNRIIHIASDEKFIEAAYWLFEKSFPQRNSYFIILPNRDHQLKYIKDREDFFFLYENEKPVEKIITLIDYSNLIVLHNLDIIKAKLVLNQSYKEKKFLWLFWGSEVYDNPILFGGKLIGSLTKKSFLINTITTQLKNIFRPIYYRIINNSSDRFSLILKASKKVDYFGVPFKEEFELMSNLNVLSKNCQFVKFAYYPLEFIFEGSAELKVKGNNILIGNSSSITNNHIEVFNILRKANIGTSNLIVPLSYGDKTYRDKIIRSGNKFFKDAFNPLTSFMRLQDYNKILQSCGIVIMNHYRQQAFGTIIGMVWMGAKVFLSNKNTIYHYFIRIGLVVYNIEQDLLNQKDSLTCLSENEINQNRRILKSEISSEELIYSLQEAFNKHL